MKRKSSIGLSEIIFALILVMDISLDVSPVVAQDEGSELGASIKVTQANPLIAKVTLKPIMAFSSVFVEVPNSIQGTSNTCLLNNLLAGKTYTCSIGAQAGDSTNGLVVTVNGRVGTNPDSPMIRKVFTVPNPTFDAVKTRNKDEAEHKKKGRAELKQNQATK